MIVPRFVASPFQWTRSPTLSFRDSSPVILLPSLVTSKTAPGLRSGAVPKGTPKGWGLRDGAPVLTRPKIHVLIRENECPN
jgi:hypothetical protein